MTDASASRAARPDAHAAVLAARASYGRLLAWLAWQWRDIAAAEDALAEAFAAALETWPERGVPNSPEGWLMTAAKRNLLDAARRRKLADDPAFLALFEAGDKGDEGVAAPEPNEIPDDRLRLLFVCAHPAIDPGAHCALMLQTVLGLDAARIAQAFLVSPEAMTKRLVRAKQKIKATGIRFEVPGADELAPRVDAVLEAIYGAYTLGDSLVTGEAASDLSEEALYLADLVAACLPGDPEALGLLALLLFCEARKPARLDAGGNFRPLSEQDPARWNRAFIDRGGALLVKAASLRDPGHFQIEAAIQAAHCHRVHGGATPWADIVVLYETLLAVAPTLGARLGHAIALAEATSDPAPSLRLLEAIEGTASLESHQPWWATRAYLLDMAGMNAAAEAAYVRAEALCVDPAVKRYLASRRTAASGASPPGTHLPPPPPTR